MGIELNSDYIPILVAKAMVVVSAVSVGAEAEAQAAVIMVVKSTGEVL